MLKTIYDFLQASETDILDHFQPNRQSNYYAFVNNGHAITLVSHADTLTRSPNFQLITKNNVIRAHNSILGADDRSGCYALEKLRHTGCNLLITTGEETGGIGARHAALDLELALTKCNLMIEFDRKNANEFVYYSHTLHGKIRGLFESYGYIESYGSYSDITEFSYIPAVNVSCGYYDQHTKEERLHLDELEMSIKRINILIKTEKITKRYLPKPERGLIYDSEYSYLYYGQPKRRDSRRSTYGRRIDTYPDWALSND